MLWISKTSTTYEVLPEKFCAWILTFCLACLPRLLAADDMGLGLRAPCCFADRVEAGGENLPIFNAATGTVEFWIKSLRDWRPVASPDNQYSGGRLWLKDFAFLHYGPVRPDYPDYINNSPLSIRYSAALGRMHVSLFHSNHAGWYFAAPLTNWCANSWRHLAVVWDVAEAETNNQLRLYMDGQRINCAVVIQAMDRLPEPPTAMVDTHLPFTVQVGSLNSGHKEMMAVMADLRISRTARYNNNFTPPGFLPPDNKYVLDTNTAVLFGFDNTLAGAGMDATGGVYSVNAVSGCVYR